MKLSKIALAAVIVSSFASVAANAAVNDQGSGIINFKGKVINAPCSIPGDGIINVELGQIANKVLESGNKYSQAVAYNIALEDCNLGEITVKIPDGKTPAGEVDKKFAAVSKVNVTFSGTADAVKNELLVNTGTSRGVGVRLINSDGNTMAVNAKSIDIPLTTGTNKLNFSARVEANGNKVETGSIVAQATYALNYL